MGLVFTAFFVIGMLIVMLLAVAIPFLKGLYILYVSGSVARRVFMIILYAILVFLFIWLKMYNVKFG